MSSSVWMEESGMPSRSGNLTRAGKPKSETTHTTFFFSSPISHSRHKQVKIDVNLIDIFFPSESGGISCLIFMPGLQRLWVSIHTSKKKKTTKKNNLPPLLSFPNEIPASVMKECSPPADGGSELWLVTGADLQLFTQEKTSSSAERKQLCTCHPHTARPGPNNTTRD